MKHFICSILFLCTLAFELCTYEGCTNPISPANGFTLSVADVSCTEAWLNLHVNSVPANVTINKNGIALFTMKVITRDTTIYDSTLSPDKNYSYQAFVTGIKSNDATIRTMDTTSHNFTWQTIFLGSALVNYFKDVAIISDDDIWCVGRFNLQDSIGMFSAAHWDGQKWNYYRLSAIDKSGNITNAELSGILVVNKNDIWFSGGSIFHWDGNKLTFSLERYTYFNGGDQTITKLWGTDDSNIYAIGTLGTILHYDSKSWQKIESETSLNIQDICGVTDQITGEQKILCVASDVFTADGNMLLQIKNNQAQVVSNQGLPAYYYSSCWFKNSRLAYVAGSGVYKSHNFFDNANWSEVTPRITTYYTNVIRGNDVNDIILCGSNGDIAHFNGVSWKDYMADNELTNFYGQLYSIAIKGNTVCAVGTLAAGQAVIIIGRRN